MAATPLSTPRLDTYSWTTATHARPRIRRLPGVLRNALSLSWGGTAVAIGMLLLAGGSFSAPTLAEAPLWKVGAAALVVLLLCGKVANVLPLVLRRNTTLRAPRRALLEIETGSAVLLLWYALLQFLGGSTAPLHPLVYALCAFLVGWHRKQVSLVLTALALLCEMLLLYSEGERALSRYAVHSALIGVFAALHVALLRGELWRQRSDHRRRIQDAIAALQKQARDFRLHLDPSGSSSSLRAASPSDSDIDAPPPLAANHDRSAEEALLLRGSVAMLDQNQHAVLELLKGALHLHTCALYFLPESSAVFRQTALNTDSQWVRRTSIPVDAGVLATIAKSPRPLSLIQPKLSLLPYYDARGGGQVDIAAFLGAPLIDDWDGRLCGVLCADRASPHDPMTAAEAEAGPLAAAPFTAADEELLASAARLLVRGVQSERVFVAVERSKYEHERLYRASKRLNRALTPEQVHRTTFEAVREICAFDFATLSHYEPTTRMHSIVAAAGEPALTQQVEELCFSDNAGWISLAVKNRHILPHGGELRDLDVPVFSEEMGLRGFASLLVVPLTYGQRVTGTLMIAGRAHQVFTKETLDILGVLANQIAVSLENARMYQAMESMATTDGLTGLANRRAFQERLAEMIQRAERQGRPVTLIMSDIDHFKSINDTYGHLVGDQVLRRVAQVVQACARKVDLAARYGGEEFAVVLEMTEKTGGGQFAERVRQEVQKLVLASDKGPFGCTLSLGMATFPDDGSAAELLIERADQALYYAKRHGRNQAIAYSDVAPLSKSAA